jgi:hypothetical protein
MRILPMNLCHLVVPDDGEGQNLVEGISMTLLESKFKKKWDYLNYKKIAQFYCFMKL